MKNLNGFVYAYQTNRLDLFVRAQWRTGTLVSWQIHVWRTIIPPMRWHSWWHVPPQALGILQEGDLK